ncbi:MAG TPA: anhydro-N-acetylmuramic acid kinase, partial [Caldilineaceae bacterium]|nr:anhydro-N-acetylmuramic acid kinase [Caldilineaceae bacterium]
MRVLGLMSGTSVDGIDVVIADILRTQTELPARTIDTEFALRQLHFETVPWPQEVRAAIFKLFREAAPVADWCQLDATLARHFAEAALTALGHAGLTVAEVDLIGSHGQTLWHQIDGGRATSTLQIGAPTLIAAYTGITTGGNFRPADIAAGGQGAPLVSTFDWHVLRPPRGRNGLTAGWRAIQNIGGIANVTFLPPLGEAGVPLAFDTGPGNALIDWAAGLASNGRLHYDPDGALAAAGTVQLGLLARWLEQPYFSAAPPKTTGRELFGVQLGEAWWA